MNGVNKNGVEWNKKKVKVVSEQKKPKTKFVKMDPMEEPTNRNSLYKIKKEIERISNLFEKVENACINGKRDKEAEDKLGEVIDKVTQDYSGIKMDYVDTFYSIYRDTGKMVDLTKARDEFESVKKSFNDRYKDQIDEENIRRVKYLIDTFKKEFSRVFVNHTEKSGNQEENEKVYNIIKKVEDRVKSMGEENTKISLYIKMVKGSFDSYMRTGSYKDIKETHKWFMKFEKEFNKKVKEYMSYKVYPGFIV